MSRECVFCGGSANSREHVWPQWVSRHFAAPFTLVDLSRGVPPRSMRILDAQVRRVCQGCNGGWMSQLEAQAKPLLEPMFDGKPMTLGADEQGSVKVAVCTQCLSMPAAGTTFRLGSTPPCGAGS